MNQEEIFKKINESELIIDLYKVKYRTKKLKDGTSKIVLHFDDIQYGDDVKKEMEENFHRVFKFCEKRGMFRNQYFRCFRFWLRGTDFGFQFSGMGDAYWKVVAERKNDRSPLSNKISFDKIFSSVSEELKIKILLEVDLFTALGSKIES